MADLDGIAGFLRAAAENERGSSTEHKQLLSLLNRLDSTFRRLTQHVLQGPALSSFLLLNAHASFLCAVRIALSGQLPPTFMALRGCLESALYAVIASSNKSNEKAWLERHTDKNRCRKIFSASNGLKILERSDPNLGKYLREQYDLSIDFGAHPNQQSVVDNIRFEEETTEGQPVSLIYLHGPKSLEVVRALGACIEVGIGTTSTAPHVIPDHPPVLEVHRNAWTTYDLYMAFLKEHGYRDRSVQPQPKEST